MVDSLWLTAIFAVVVGSIWIICMYAIPRKGFTKFLERCAVGAGLCLLCFLILAPLGITVPQTPLSSMLAGYLGLPGVVFATFLSHLP